jgi:Phosphohydrolase-associated domain
MSWWWVPSFEQIVSANFGRVRGRDRCRVANSNLYLPLAEVRPAVSPRSGAPNSAFPKVSVVAPIKRADGSGAAAGTSVSPEIARFDEKRPALTKVRISIDAFIAVEVLKTLAFEAVIMSSRLKSAENRGQWVVEQIFGELTEDSGYLLMPEDWRLLTPIPATLTGSGAQFATIWPE